MSIEIAQIPRFDPVPTMHLKKKKQERKREKGRDRKRERERKDGREKERKKIGFLPTVVLSTQVKDT